MPTAFTVGFCWGELKPPGPDHEYVTPGVVEPPLITMDWVPQVTVPPTAVALGRLVSPATLTVAAAVHPFALLVTVTTYAPEVLAVGF